MAKSTRSKVKRAHRAKKRDDGVYAATEAARLERLSSKLRALCDAPIPQDGEASDDEDAAMQDDAPDVGGPTSAATMELDGVTEKVEKKVSTHGPRNSRREQWRVSKGMTPRPKSRGMNRQGGVAAKQRAGRAHRRR